MIASYGTGTKELGQVWEQCLEKLQEEIPSPYFLSVIDPLRLVSIKDGRCTVAAPNSFTKDVISSRYIDTLSRVLSEALGKEVQVAVTVSSPPQVIENIASRLTEVEESEPSWKPPPSVEVTPQKKYTFENFVVGSSNKFAYNAALMVAEYPGQTYNPLFIYGGTGLGKTHLLYAIKEYAERINIDRPGHSSLRIKYVQTSRFIDEFIETATMKGDKAAFDQEYINNKIVLFDDIQALGNTQSTQDKFFDIFNLLYASNIHVVLSSDRPPSEIPKLSERIKSRFEGGLLTDITPPDLETRIAILRMKARAENVEIPEDAMVFIASKVTDNIRSLEGLMNRVVAYARLYGTRIELPMVQDVLKDQIAESNLSRTPSVELIQNAVSNYYGVSWSDLVGPKRNRLFARARQVAMYLSKELTGSTLMSIGEQFGGRDHSTVIYSCEKVENMIKLKKDIYHEVTELTNIINKSI